MTTVQDILREQINRLQRILNDLDDIEVQYGPSTARDKLHHRVRERITYQKMALLTCEDLN